MRIFSGPLAAVVLLSSGIALAQTAVAAKPGTVVETTSPVSADRVRAYVARPAYFAKVKTEEAPEGPALISAKPVVKMKTDGKLDTVKFASDLRAALKDKVRGGAMQLRKNGAVIATEEWGKARSPTEGNIAFTVNTRMHIASLSKLLTTMGTLRALEDKNLSWDTKIGAYLPAYWSVGSNVSDVTFQALMKQRSGFGVDESSTDGCGCNGNYAQMKIEVAEGVVTSPERRYENVNFSILRVLDSILTGAVSKGSIYQVAGVNPDIIWDIRTTDAFLTYMNQKIFSPNGVPNVSTVPTSFGALGYQNATDEKGWDSGDVATQLGGVGFRVSVKEVLDVMDAFRRKNTIIPAAKAQAALDAGLGLDRIKLTIAGKVYDKNGGWGGGEGSEHTVGYFLGEGMEVAVFTNSPLPNDGSLRDTVLNAYTNNLQ